MIITALYNHFLEILCETIKQMSRTYVCNRKTNVPQHRTDHFPNNGQEDFKNIGADVQKKEQIRRESYDFSIIKRNVGMSQFTLQEIIPKS